jgi:hypothetical protein
VEFNNREIAVLIWLGVVLVWMIARADMRGSLFAMVKSLAAPILLLPIIGYFAWAAGLVFLASKSGLWNWDLASDTVFWALASAALLIRSEEVLEGDHFLLRKAATALRVTILIEVFVNLVVFPLIVELLLFPLLAFLVLASALAPLNPELKAAKGPIDGVMAVIGVSLLVYVVISLATNPDLVNETTGLRCLLPVWLSLGVLPYFYFFALYAGYSSAFKRINFNNADRATRRRLKWGLVRRCHVQAGRLGQFRGAWLQGVVKADANESPEEQLARFASQCDEAKAA